MGGYDLERPVLMPGSWCQSPSTDFQESSIGDKQPIHLWYPSLMYRPPGFLPLQFQTPCNIFLLDTHFEKGDSRKNSLLILLTLQIWSRFSEKINLSIDIHKLKNKPQWFYSFLSKMSQSIKKYTLLVVCVKCLTNFCHIVMFFFSLVFSQERKQKETS